MADPFVFDASDYFALGRNCQRAAGLVIGELKKAGDRCGAIWERLAKGRAPVREGHLRRSVAFATSTSLAGSVTLMGSNVPYAKAQDTGSPAHIIAPKRAKVLAWQGTRVVGPVLRGVTAPRKGNMIFARIVHHPGTKGNRFLTGSFQELRPRFRQEFEKVGAEIAKALRGAA